MEGWQAWDVALRCAGQLRMAHVAAVGIDMAAAFQIGNALGYDLVGLAELLPACEGGMVSAINEKISDK
ncbi:MAG: hypothetical protein PHE27_02955 [Alphaproteobacteria bacterium]|nr:hypothetical protein [Alphaproteobacteria bacterium]